jgi:hypothetical protein
MCSLLPSRALAQAISLALVLVAFQACGGDGGTDIVLPSLNVSTSTSGPELDPDGYTFTVDGQNPRPIGVQATVTVDRLTDGQHTVELSGVAPNCAVAGENPKAVSITGGATAAATFTITCQAGSGGVRVITTTTGAGSDPDGFTLLLDGVDRGPIGANAETTLNELQEGSHTVGLGGLAANCQAGENPRSMTVVGGEVTEVTFAVVCTVPGPTTGTLEVSVQTTGPNQDPDGYQVSVDGGGSQSIGVNDAITLANVPAAPHSVGLGGLATNCQAAGENPRSVTVTAGGIAEVTFAVTCTAAPPVTGTLRISVQTTGANQDSDGYQVSVDGGRGQPIGTSATISLANTSAAQHTVRLQGLASNCAVTGENPIGAAVPAGGTVTVTFAVACVATTGELRVTISGLPGGVQAAVTVDGPNNFNRAVTETQTLSGLTPGSYGVSASSVTSSGTTYTPSVSRPNVDVAAGSTATVTVTYTGQAPITLNMRIDGLYLTQSTQTYDGSVPLVAGRDAYLRVFVVANETNSARPRVRARLSRSGATIQTYTIDATGSSVPTQVQEGVLGSSWNQRIPGSLIQPGLAIVAELDPSEAIDESNETDNRFPTSGAKALTVRTVPSLKIRFVPIQQGSGPPGNVSSQQLIELARRMHPLNAVDVDVDPNPFAASVPLQTSQDSWAQVLSDLDGKRVAEGSDRTYFGIARLNYGRSDGLVGLAFQGLPTAMGWDDGGDAPRVVAHELGHTWNRRHTSCGGPDPQTVDPLYPYSGGQIGVTGLDVASAALKPASSPDIMGYCFQNFWISDYTYRNVMSFRQSSAAVAGVRSVPQPSLLIWGRIVDGRPVLEPAFELVTHPSLPIRPGPYSVTAAAADGSQLFTLSFDVALPADGARGNGHFAFAVPMDDARSARLATMRLAGPGGAVTTSRTTAALQLGPTAAPILRREGRNVSIVWNATAYPTIMVRDPDTGAVMGFGRGGNLLIQTDKLVLDVDLSDGVRSQRLRLAINRS